jgi:hypothetical protein
VNGEVLVHLKNIESPARVYILTDFMPHGLFVLLLNLQQQSFHAYYGHNVT